MEEKDRVVRGFVIKAGFTKEEYEEVKNSKLPTGETVEEFLNELINKRFAKWNEEGVLEIGSMGKSAQSLSHLIVTELTGLQFDVSVGGKSEWLYIRTPNPNVMFVLEVADDGQIGVSEVNPTNRLEGLFQGHDFASEGINVILNYLLPRLKRCLKES